MANSSTTRAGAFRWTSSIAAMIAAAVVAPTTASAQQNSDPAATAAQTDRSSRDEEIVVTGERRSVRQFSAPSTVTALSGDDMEERGVVNLDTLAPQVPGLTVSNAGVANLVNIRGIGRSDVGLSAAAGVVIYRDGVPTFNGYFSGSEPYFDTGAVEVYKGPQGTFAGQNSTGGAIFIRSADPVIGGGLDGFAQVQAGTHEMRGFQGALNVPLGDTFAVRIATNLEERGRYYDYSGPFEGHPNELSSAAGRIVALWEPTSQFRARLAYDHDYIDQGSSSYSPATATTDIYDIQSDATLRDVNRFYRIAADLSYTFDNGGVLRSLSGYQSGRAINYSDTDGTALVDTFLRYRVSQDVASQEFTYVSPATDRLRYTLGLSYMRDFTDLPYFASGVESLYGALTLTREATSQAAFAHFTYDVTPSLHLEVGGRYNEGHLEHDLVLGVGSFGVFTPLGVGPSTVPDDQSTTGKLGFSYDVSDNQFLYAFVATGHKNNGLNAGFTNPTFEGEDVTDYEIGYRQRLWDNQVVLQLAAYWYQYDNYQFQGFDPITSSRSFGNVPGASESQGIEAQITGNFDDTRINLSIAWADSALPDNFTAQESPSSPLLDLSGRGLPFSPEWSVSAGLEHTFHGGLGDLTPRVDVTYVSEQWATLWRNPGELLGARTLVNAQLQWERADWIATAFVTNLTDEEYVAAYYSRLRAPGVPRQAGVRLMRTF